MADQGKWFKLWLSSLDDPHLEDLSLEDWARWARFGAFIKKHGKNGKMELRYPARVTQNLLRLNTFEDVISAIKRFPNYHIEESQNETTNVTVESVTYLVTCKNWHKYQGDFSSDRVKRYRANVTANVTAQEEKRGEERRREENTTVAVEVPQVLKPLELFATNPPLIAKWQTLAQGWTTAYPGIDIFMELRAAHNWLLENPDKPRKSKVKFLGNWFRNAHGRLSGKQYAKN